MYECHKVLRLQIPKGPCRLPKNLVRRLRRVVLCNNRVLRSRIADMYNNKVLRFRRVVMYNNYLVRRSSDSSYVQ